MFTAGIGRARAEGSDRDSALFPFTSIQSRVTSNGLMADSKMNMLSNISMCGVAGVEVEVCGRDRSSDLTACGVAKKIHARLRLLGTTISRLNRFLGYGLMHSLCRLMKPFASDTNYVMYRKGFNASFVSSFAAIKRGSNELRR